MGKFLRKIFRVLLAAYLGGLLLFMLMQGTFIYFPTRASEAELLSEAGGRGLEPWRDSEGTLIGWQTPDGDPSACILITHGNAGYALHRDYLVYYLRRAQAERPGKIYILEYPGYGARTGRPGQTAMVQAGLQAVELLANTGKPLLLGESIGTGIACQIAHKTPDKIRGLILLTPFDSLVSMGSHHYPWLPVKWLLTDRMDSQKALENYPGPVAFLVAENDEVTPPKLGLSLYTNYAGKKRLWMIPGSTHNEASDGLSRDEWKAVLNFAAGQP